MKRNALAATCLILFCLSLLTACPDTQTGDIDAPSNPGTTPPSNPGDINLELVFTLGLEPAMNNIYAAWLETPDSTDVRNIRVCPRLLNNSLTGTALAYWQVNKYPSSSPKKDETGYDAISGATIQKASFSIPFTVPEGFPRQFSVWFETDYSFNGNDWFEDQPSIVYKADIDLDSAASTFPLQLAGWAASDDIADMQSEYIDPMPGHGVLVSEMRYITHKRKTGDSFGAIDDSDKIVTKLVGNLVVNRLD